MPHLIVEFSAPLKNVVETPDFREKLLEKMRESGVFTSRAMKYRTLGYETYQCIDHPEGQNIDFIHVQLRLLSGRTLDVHQNLSKTLATVVSSFFSKDVSITCEIQEISRASYTKTLL